MFRKAFIFFFFFFFFLLSVSVSLHAANALKNEGEIGSGGDGAAPAGSLVKKDQRRSLVSTEYGEVWSVDVNGGHRKPYHIQFITLEPNSLFLPVLLHAYMVFYVNTGSGRLSWTDDDKIRRVDIKRGDLYRLTPGSVFFVQSNLETERQKLRINAIFTSNSDDDLYDPAVGPYSSIRDLVRGFDPKLLQSAFKVSEEVIESIVNGTGQSAIVHAIPTKKETFWDLEARFLKTFLLGNDGIAFNSKKKKETTTYNIFDEDPDFENCNGWSLTVSKKNTHLLKGSNIGFFMVNLTKGSIMGPHWNPRATEITVVLQGHGMVRVVCSSTEAKKSECRNMRFRVHEGDVFSVPRFHPMAQMSFNNDSLVFMGFSTTEKKNYPQFLAGKYSVLQTLDKLVLAASFNVTSTTIDQLLSAQADSFIIDCTSCAEEEEKAMLEEIEKKREEEEAKKREEEEARKREQEEQDRKREEEEAKKREEEERERQEEERKREEEEREGQEEEREREKEARKQEEEQAAREREEEAAREREEEAAREREEEAAREREEEAAREQEEEAAREREEEAAREQEEQAAREREEQAAKQRQEQAAREREEQEAAREREEQEAAREREQEAARRREEEGRQGGDERRQEEERERERRQQEEWERREEDAQREQEEARRQQQEWQGRAGQPEEQEVRGGGFNADEGRRYLSALKV
ncbi:globulin-1 S allele-like [Pyrus ussuriensis x Pyrus communis]|uniref:Globulin-1 S allele-like n=1 Tax=Pyrus ussuriensis x Pyrus communis TaxID=2448454 RepID=A0A5N5I0A5_9ROSA|nr:globulin-1 S allele-like [Pyrus ussuriensis x Pyrus communis]